MYTWSAWLEDDNGNTTEISNEGCYGTFEESVTEAGDGQLLKFLGIKLVDADTWAPYTIERDYDGRAYITKDGRAWAVVESVECCSECHGDPSACGHDDAEDDT